LLPSSWAMPCVPIAGKQSGVYVVPQIGAGVWIEFEQGDPDYPIWVGGYWGAAAELPVLALAGNPASPSIVLQSGLQNTISISDMAGPTGGILLQSLTGAFIAINEIGITISNGQGATVVLAGPTVTINNGALVVT
ncbi:MAG TPA: phage baseplate assembly protein V, partial [Rhodanobacter sp.]|nr:phage baseplate assembly protein V [Rhodanobacter sp.]